MVRGWSRYARARPGALIKCVEHIAQALVYILIHLQVSVDGQVVKTTEPVKTGVHLGVLRRCTGNAERRGQLARLPLRRAELPLALLRRGLSPKTGLLGPPGLIDGVRCGGDMRCGGGPGRLCGRGREHGLRGWPQLGATGLPASGGRLGGEYGVRFCGERVPRSRGRAGHRLIHGPDATVHRATDEAFRFRATGPPSIATTTVEECQRALDRLAAPQLQPG